MLRVIFFLMTSLAPCPESPNCVNSEATDSWHAIEPFPIHDTPQESIDLIGSIIRSMPQAEVIQQTPLYLHAEFTSRIFHFVDDVEFEYNPEENVIEVRSASRTGYYDLGVNRSRVETIREAYDEI